MNMLQKAIALSLLSFTLLSANPLEINTKNLYSNLTTTELEIRVQTLSNSGNLPFEMGIELIKRWSHKA